MPINTSSLSDSVLAAAYTANRVLEPEAAEFSKEAEILKQTQIQASDEYLGKERPETEQQIKEAEKASTDLEIYKRGIDESGADPTEGQKRYMKGLENKASKLNDLKAGQIAAEALEEQRQALIEDLRRRQLHNNSLIDKVRNARDLNDLHIKNVELAKAAAKDKGGIK